jgi:putative ABC transport system permease protein
LAEDEVLVTYGGAPDAEVARALSGVRDALPGAEELGVDIAVPRGAAEDGAQTGPPLSLSISDPARSDPYGLTDVSRYLVVASTDGLRTLDVPEATIDALLAGKVVVFDLVGPDASVSLVGPGGATRPLERGDVAADPMTRFPNGNQVALVSAETARRWGAEPVQYATLFRAAGDLTHGQVRAVERAVQADPQSQIRQYLTDPDAPASDMYVEIGRQLHIAPRSDGAAYTWVAAGASLLFTLLVVALALALDASESGNERALLAAIGAPPAVRRSIVAWQAFLLPALGALVAVPAGLLATFAVLSDRSDTTGPARGVAVQVPWAAIALLLVAVPLATAGLTWLGAALRGRRREDLAAFSLAAD